MSNTTPNTNQTKEVSANAYRTFEANYKKINAKLRKNIGAGMPQKEAYAIHKAAIAENYAWFAEYTK